MSGFAELKAAVDRLERLCFGHYGNEMKDAKGLPGKYASAAASVEMHQSYHSNKDEAVIGAAKRLQKQFVEVERARGEQERDARLVEIAAEIESLRAALPSLAAAAAIEAGTVARAAVAKEGGAS